MLLEINLLDIAYFEDSTAVVQWDADYMYGSQQQQPFHCVVIIQYVTMIL